MQKPNAGQTEAPRTWTLKPENELRFEVQFGISIKLKLVEGDAECFGTELAKDREYTFSAINSCVFTWHGCTISISGNCHAYVADETPMTTYVNTHQICHERREDAKEKKSSGPKVMVVGATDSGKSSLCRILCNYSIRRGHPVTFVDLDIDQGSITVPEMLSAITVESPVDVEEGFGLAAPLVYFYGHATPSGNSSLYKLQMKHLADDVERKLESNPELLAAGLIINTCGWMDSNGSDLLFYSIELFKVDIVLVIDHERLYSDLNTELKSKRPTVQVVKLKKSGGVVTRDQTHRRKSKMNRIRHYFYGENNSLCPHSTVIDFRDFTIIRVGGGPQAPMSALPIGAQPTNPNRVTEVTPDQDILHSVLGVCLANSKETILESNVAGFVYVTDISVERRKMTVLAPCPGPLPGKFLIKSKLKWLE